MEIQAPQPVHLFLSTLIAMIRRLTLVLLAVLLGGFTTFSAFGLDAIYLIRRGELMTAASYAGLSVIVGVAAVWLGFRLVAAWPQPG